MIRPLDTPPWYCCFAWVSILFGGVARVSPRPLAMLWDAQGLVSRYCLLWVGRQEMSTRA